MLVTFGAGETWKWVYVGPRTALGPLQQPAGALGGGGVPVHSPQLQFLISSGAAGLGGRGLQCEREDLNEKAGCSGGAPLFSAFPGGGVSAGW